MPKKENNEIESKSQIVNNYTTEVQGYYNQYINKMIRYEKDLLNISKAMGSMVDTIGFANLIEDKEAIGALQEANDIFLEITTTLSTVETTEQLRDYHNSMSITALSFSKFTSDIIESTENGSLDTFRDGVQSYRDAKSNLEVAISLRQESTKGMFFLKIEE